jgi:hypothetical protein
LVLRRLIRWRLVLRRRPGRRAAGHVTGRARRIKNGSELRRRRRGTGHQADGNREDQSKHCGLRTQARESWSEPQRYTENCQRRLISRCLVIPDYGMGRAPPVSPAVATWPPRRIVAFAPAANAREPARRR